MYRKVCSFVSGCVSKLRATVSHVAVLGVLAFNGLCLSAFAQQGTGIEIQESNIDWTALPGQIMTALMAPVVVGIGIALSVWVVFAGVRFFRRAAN